MIQLEISRTTTPRGLRLVGELDMSTAPALDDALEAEIAHGGDITLDLAGVAFMDSSGIQSLLRAAQRLQGKGRLVLLAPGEAVGRVFEVIRLDDVDNIEVKDES